MSKVAEKARGILIETPILPILIIYFIISIIFVPHFATVFNIRSFFLQASDILIVACGLTFVVLNGGIDFSVTATLTLGSVVGAFIMAMSPLASMPFVSIPVAILVMLLIGLIIGGINGFAVSRLKMPSFIATTATGLAFSGLAVLFTMQIAGRPSIFGLPSAFFALGGSRQFFFVPIAISGLCCLFCHWLLTRTKFGRELYAIGINNVCAEVSGVNVKRITASIMVLSGFFAAIQGILLTARNEAGIASLGDRMFLPIIACVIIGGSSTAGGFGGIKNTLCGVLFIALINNTMNLWRVEWNWLMSIQGLLILGASLIGIAVKRSRRLNALGGKL